MADFRISTKVARHSESSAQYAYATHGRRRQSMSAGLTIRYIKTDTYHFMSNLRQPVAIQYIMIKKSGGTYAARPAFA